MEIWSLAYKDLREGLEKGQFSVTEVIKTYLTHLRLLDKKLNAFILIAENQALARAKELDAKLKRGDRLGSLFGLPLAIKDVITTKDLVTTAGSKILKNYQPSYNATVVEKILAADAIILGKTNCDEFAMGASGENSAFGATCNPWDLSRVPGGSSSGSAAAVAAGQTLVALGTDTGGSIRQPASFCGVVGLKPTYGRVSRYGLIAMASSFDQIGTITRQVAEAAQVLQVIAGFDERDATSQKIEVANYHTLFNQPIKKLCVGIPREFFGEGLAAGVAEQVNKAIAKLEELGVRTKEVSLSTIPYALATYYIITPAEVSANLARFDGLRFGQNHWSNKLIDYYKETRGEFLGSEVKRRIILGTYVLSAGYYDAYYKKALTVRDSLKKDFARVFKEVDLLITPTSPTVAFKLGERLQDPLAMYLADIYTVPVNIAGLPAISVPCGVANNLPVGLQFIGPAWSESLLLQAAYTYEQVRGEFNLPKV